MEVRVIHLNIPVMHNLTLKLACLDQYVKRLRLDMKQMLESHWKKRRDH